MFGVDWLGRPDAVFCSFACASHQKAKAAQDAGYFEAEIVPMKVRSVTPADGATPEVVVEKILSKDEGIRPQTTLDRKSVV